MKVAYIPTGERVSVKCLAHHPRPREGQINAPRSALDPGSKLGRCLPQAPFQGALPNDSNAPPGRAKGMYSRRIPYMVLSQFGVPELNPGRR